MLDLKAKLAAAGLVSEKEIAEAEAARKRGGKPGGKPSGQQQPPRGGGGLAVASLRGKNKGEIYDAVRKFVERVRLDPVGGTPSDAAEPFHFPGHTGRIGKLVLEPDLAKAIGAGEAAIVAYMSNHGLAHAVVPPQAAREIAAVMPLWLRVLAGDPEAGRIEPPADRPAR